MGMPMLIFVTGSTASGKTEIANRLSRMLKWPFFDYDDLVQPFLVGIEKRCCGDVENLLDFYQTWRSESYATFFSPIIRNVNNGLCALAAAPLTRELKDEAFIGDFKSRLGTECRIVNIHLLPESAEHFRMLRNRNLDRDRDTIRTWKDFSARFCMNEPAWKVDDLVVIRFDSCESLFDVVVNELRNRELIS